MIIKNEYPPNIGLIDKAFHVKDTPNILYCYGGTIYSPSGGNIPIWLERHEEVHSVRQYDDPDKWWEQYIEDKKFRLEEELLAHKKEYEVYKDLFNRKYSRGHLVHMAERLSSSMYGNCVSYKEAKGLIKGD